MHVLWRLQDKFAAPLGVSVDFHSGASVLISVMWTFSVIKVYCQS